MSGNGTGWKAELNEKSGTIAFWGPLSDADLCRASDGLGRLFTVNLATKETADAVMFPDIDPEKLAIARKAGAAPEMFDALLNVVGLLDTPIARRKNADDPFFCEMLDGIRAALSKATGK